MRDRPGTEDRRCTGSAGGAGRARRWLLCGVLCLGASAHLPAEDELRLSSIHNLLQDRVAHGLVLLRGTVTYDGTEWMVQDGSGAVAVERRPGNSAFVGDEVEVEGRLEMRSGVPIVREAVLRRLWSGSMPLPLAITPDEAAEGAYNGMLVTSEGTLVKEDSGAGGAVRLTLDGGHQLFTCLLEERPATPKPGFETGAMIRCTGVLSVDPSPGVLGTGTFLILLRGVADLRQIEAAPWWTPRHLELLFGVLVALVWLAYRIHLRNAQARLAMVLEERTRIAREIHDTLAQGFAGIALQLQALTHTMGRQSAAAETHLAMALQMVRRSRAEAHRSIATLRTLQRYDDLASVCRRLLGQLTEPAGLSLSVLEQGVPRPLSDEVLSQVVRIAQEAVANTVEHAGARSVTVTITHAAGAMTMEVRDDGRGFDLKTDRTLDTGHFGITGMQERAAGIHGRLLLHSGPGGTVLQLRLPRAEASRNRVSTMLQWCGRTMRTRGHKMAEAEP